MKRKSVFLLPFFCFLVLTPGLANAEEPSKPKLERPLIQDKGFYFEWLCFRDSFEIR